MKTLGQVAYEAWRERNSVEYTDRIILPDMWDMVSQKTRNDMQAAAEAVAKHIQKGFILNSPEERAVIEAAKAWRAAQLHEPYRDDEDQRDRENITTFALQDAVEALQEVKKDE